MYFSKGPEYEKMSILINRVTLRYDCTEFIQFFHLFRVPCMCALVKYFASNMTFKNFVNYNILNFQILRVLWPNLKNLSGGLNLSRGLNMVGST